MSKIQLGMDILVTFSCFDLVPVLVRFPSLSLHTTQPGLFVTEITYIVSAVRPIIVFIRIVGGELEYI